MAQNNTSFAEFLSREVRKYQGTCVPVLTDPIRRHLIKRLPVKKMHPNPEDDFCDPKIGPNYEIIARYREKAANCVQHRYPFYSEPIIVERMKPDGWLIVNGHHRWAAAVMLGVTEPLSVKITNVTRLADIRRMLSRSKNTKRATLDLDEVVLRTDKHEPAEKAVPFPLRLHFSQRLRLGIPGLFSYLDAHGYDIWVYSKNYYSQAFIRMFFRLKHVRVTGIVTGPIQGREKSRVETEMRNHYHTTVSIDRESVLRVDHRTKAFEEYPLTGAGEDWSAQVVDRIGKFTKNEKTST